MEISSLAFSKSASAAFRFSLAKAYWLGISSPVNNGMLVETDIFVPWLAVLTYTVE
ncbi:unknown [Bacteroides eggerthii CAG:109]|jgi:hypothetical protein|nr:unknown [Bacteroides eggerthii CAG:109]